MYREPTVMGRTPGLKSMVQTRRKKEIFNQNRMKKQEFKKNEERLRNLQDIFKRSNIQIIGVPEGEEEEQQIKNLFKQIIKENFPNLAKEIDFPEVQEAQRVPKKLARKHTPRHIIITLAKVKDKERILKVAREKETVTYKGVPIRLSADFLKETLPARREWKELFKVMKGEHLHPRLLYPAKLSFRMEGRIKCFSDKVKLKRQPNTGSNRSAHQQTSGSKNYGIFTQWNSTQQRERRSLYPL